MWSRVRSPHSVLSIVSTIQKLLSYSEVVITLDFESSIRRSNRRKRTTLIKVTIPFDPLGLTGVFPSFRSRSNVGRAFCCCRSMSLFCCCRHVLWMLLMSNLEDWETINTSITRGGGTGFSWARFSERAVIIRVLVNPKIIWSGSFDETSGRYARTREKISR